MYTVYNSDYWFFVVVIVFFLAKLPLLEQCFPLRSLDGQLCQE